MLFFVIKHRTQCTTHALLFLLLGLKGMCVYMLGKCAYVLYMKVMDGTFILGCGFYLNFWHNEGVQKIW